MAGEAGAPEALGTGTGIHTIPPAQHLVTPLGVAAPRQTTTALHIRANYCLVELQDENKYSSFTATNL